MFDNPNQYNMFSGGPLSTPTFPPAPGSYYSITGGAPNVPGQVIPPVVPAQQNTQVPFGATHVSDKSAGPKYSYLLGSYEIILDAEYTDNFIINSARSKSIMEKYTEAIARITYFFESQ